MSEPALLSLPWRTSGRKPSRRNFQARSLVACVEQLEARCLLAAAPTGVVIVAPSPAEGLPGGGTVLTVNGQNFGPIGAPPTVTFVNQATSASTPGTGVAVTINEVQLTVTQPALPLGSYDVIVTTGAGSSTASATSAYQVVSVVAPTVTSVTPFGAAGSTVTIQGTGFTSATQVNFVNRATSVSTPGTGLQTAGDSQLTVTVPSLALGDYDVTVTNSAGTSTMTPATDTFTDVAQAVIAATKFTNPSNPVVSSVSTLNVISTADFASSGSLFVETSNGLATVAYTGVTPTSFTGCSVVTTDPFHVGATDSTGTLNLTYPAVFQATNKTFEYSIKNQTKLPSGAQNAVTFAMYWSSVGAPGNPASFYYLDSPNPDGSNGTFSPVTKLGVGGTIPTYTIADSGGLSNISLPYVPTNSARFFFGVGAAPQLGIVKHNSGDWDVSTPAPGSTNSAYDYFELTMDASGADNSVPNGLRFLPTLNINTSQVDQFGFPITLTGMNNNNNGTSQLASVGVTLSTNVARDAIFSAYSSLHPSGTDPYSSLVLPSSNPSQPYRILNPGKVQIATTDALGYVFDDPIQKLFETALPNLTLKSGVNQQVYTSTRTTVTALGSDNAVHTYNVLQFSGPGIGPVNVFEPFFSTNAPTGSPLPPTAAFYQSKPPALKWLTSASETAGQMVFGNDGVFGDAGLQTGLDATQKAILADLENQIVAALNRGVATTYSTTADWQNSVHFYPDGQVSNSYAKFLHQQAISGTPIFIDGKAYAIAYDDQGGHNPSLVLENQSNVTATLGPWTSPPPSNQNSAFLAAVYQDLLNRPIDPAALNYWLGVLAGGASRDQVSLQIAGSVEARTRVIDDLYTKLLHRAADPQGLNQCLALFAAGWSQPQIKSLIFGSAEYFQVRGGGSNAGFLDAVFHDELSRSIDSQALAFFSAKLAAGQSRATVASIVIGSQEAQQDLVMSYYLAYLGRPSDPVGLAYWTNLLQQHNFDDPVEAGFLGSAEFYRHV